MDLLFEMRAHQFLAKFLFPSLCSAFIRQIGESLGDIRYQATVGFVRSIKITPVGACVIPGHSSGALAFLHTLTETLPTSVPRYIAQMG